MLEQGIHFDVPSAVYFSDPAPQPSLTQSIAKVLIERSPLHAKCEHPRLRDPVPSEDEPVEKYNAAKAIGSAAHLLMIRRGKELEIADFESWRSNDAKAVRENAERLGKTPILIHHFERATQMVNAGRVQLLDAGFSDAFAADQGHGEVCIVWQEGELWFRSLIDWMPQYMDIFYDYKTTGMSAAPHGLGRMMVDAGWDIQAAMHERGLSILDPNINPKKPVRRKFRFVVQENEPPYALVVCEPSDAAIAMGRKKLDYAVNLWRACMRSGAWPAYPPELYVPEYPGYAETAWLNREIHEAARERRPGGFDAENLRAG